MSAHGQSYEAQAREMLDRMGVEDAANWSSGEVIELANLSWRKCIGCVPPSQARERGNRLRPRRRMPIFCCCVGRLTVCVAAIGTTTAISGCRWKRKV